MTPEQMVREFHRKYGHLVSNLTTTSIPENVKALRKKLIKEEFEELMMGLSEDNLIEIADGIADLVYVAVGTAITYGIPFDRIFKEVHSSNLTKTVAIAEPGQKYGTKTPKGPDYIPPHIWRILFEPELHTQLENGESN